MKNLLLILLLLTGTAFAAEPSRWEIDLVVTGRITMFPGAEPAEQDRLFAWDENPENMTDLVEGYELRWGSTSAAPATFTETLDVPGNTASNVTIELAPGVYWFAVYAYATIHNALVYSVPSDVINVIITP